MAKLIKDLYPEVTIVFGGANYDGEMGWSTFGRFPSSTMWSWAKEKSRFRRSGHGRCWQDAPDWCPPAVAFRQDGQVRLSAEPRALSPTSRGPVRRTMMITIICWLNLGETAKGLDRILLYEGSRGCWWGEKHHCTFCGLNAQSMKFRAKSPEQVAREMTYLSHRYDTARFRLVDNIIDMKYIDQLFGKFAADHCDLDVFIETKSNLQKSADSDLGARRREVHAARTRKS